MPIPMYEGIIEDMKWHKVPVLRCLASTPCDTPLNLNLKEESLM